MVKYYRLGNMLNCMILLVILSGKEVLSPPLVKALVILTVSLLFYAIDYYFKRLYQQD